MAGEKRTWDKMNHQAPQQQEQVDGGSTTYIQSMFETFRAELDEHHDRRERVLKASKDITANSKKVIFALQRVRTLGTPISDKKVEIDVNKFSKIINDLLVGIGPDLQDSNTYRYQRNISGGIQEYMEAILFKHYLQTQRIMTYEEAANTVPGNVLLTYEDYVLGLFDTTGEMMRFAITYLATHGKLPGDQGTSSILVDMQALRSSLDFLDVGGSYGLTKDFEAKMKVTRASVEKVENGVYSMIVRGKERPPGWTPDLSGPRDNEQIESY